MDTPAPDTPTKQPSAAPATPRPVPDAWIRFWTAVWTALAALWTGSTLISGALGEWIRHGPLPRIIGLLLAAGFLYGLPHTHRILATLALAWIALALLLAHRATPRPAPAKTPEQPATQAPAQSPADVDLDTLTRHLHALLQPEGGVHLQALGKALGQTAGKPPVPTKDVRALCARHGVRVRAGVRVPGAGGREGIHRDDIPPLPTPTTGTPLEGVVVPGQSNNNNGNNTPTGPPGEGHTITQDPHNPHRWNVHTANT
ncbi:hypothetical protein ACRAR1_07045 [Streptomyces sanyensis]|uniref:hypothetical protein n=1 Tax=Streptomyces sanyensis TaxID=568869 RepID=UPI003D772FC8